MYGVLGFILFIIDAGHHDIPVSVSKTAMPLRKPEA